MGSLIGVDEAGRGPVIGPLVIAGLKIENENKNLVLKKMGVRDSKKCTRKRREYLADEIKKVGKYSIEIITANDIDEFRKHKTLNVLEGEFFSKVINRLQPDSDTTIIVDAADANEKTFKGYIEANVKKYEKIISIHKADELHLVVAAASILAKTQRDFEVDKIAHDLESALGSGYPADPITKHFLEKWIKEKGDLPPHTRRSWNTAKKLIRKYQKPIKTLDQF